MVDIYRKRVYAIDQMFFSNAKIVAIMSNQKLLILTVFFLYVYQVHEYRQELLTPYFCL